MLIQGETFFQHNVPTFKRLVYLKIRNTTLTSAICVVQLQLQNKKFTTINISLIYMERSNFCTERSNFCMEPLKVNKCHEYVIYLSENTRALQTKKHKHLDLFHLNHFKCCGRITKWSRSCVHAITTIEGHKRKSWSRNALQKTNFLLSRNYYLLSIKIYLSNVT